MPLPDPTNPMRDPNIARTLKPGLFAKVFVATREPATDPFKGDHLWLEVTQMHPKAVQLTGRIISKPRSRCGVSQGDHITVSVNAVEAVAANPPAR
jgi:hypothetical protein